MRYHGERCYLRPFEDFTDFDRFFLINHIELGKTWKDLKDNKYYRNKNKDFEEPDEPEEEKFSGWEENKPQSLCLFCDLKAHGVESVFTHMKDAHSFDFQFITSEIDFYEKVKVVNYIRHVIAYFGQQKDCGHLWNRMKKVESTVKRLICDKINWMTRNFMMPALEDDALLWCHNKSKYRRSLVVDAEKVDIYKIVSTSVLRMNDLCFQ